MKCFVLNPPNVILSRIVSPVGLSSVEYQQPGKASCVSVNWTLGDSQLEVVNTSTGRRRDSGTPSRLCKHALFTRWNRLYRKVRANHRGILLVRGGTVEYIHVHIVLGHGNCSV